jgi:hypothetical protein
MPPEPFQKVIFDRIEYALFILLFKAIPLIFFLSPKLARQDFLRQLFARSIKRLGTADLT